MYMQTVLNTWFQGKLFTYCFQSVGQIHNQISPLSSKLTIHLNFGRYKTSFRSTANENGGVGWAGNCSSKQQKY